MTPSDTGWRMNSDTWLPTAPARVTLTKPPVTTESALKMQANQTYIEGARAEHSEPRGLRGSNSPVSGTLPGTGRARMVSFPTVYQRVALRWRAIILLFILALATFLIVYPDRGSPDFLVVFDLFVIAL